MSFMKNVAGHFTQGVKYQNLSKEEQSSVTPTRFAFSIKTLWQHRRVKAGLLCVAILLIFAFFLTFGVPSQLTPPHDDLDKPTYLRLIISAPRPTSNLCKTIISAAALDYPTPIFTSWYRSDLTPDVQAGILRYTELNGILNYLASIPPEHDNDLCLIVDGYNTLFQLRPQVLLSRYYELNRRANARIRAQFQNSRHHHHHRSTNITQRIIFSAQRRCVPNDPASPACTAVPESDLPTDIFGPQLEDASNIRPRWLASGFALGPASDLRALYTRAAELALQDPDSATDQSVFSAIFGEQERFRLALSSPDNPTPHANPTTKTPAEYGLGVDTLSTLTHKTAHAPLDTSNTPLATTNLGRPHTTQLHLPPDIALSTPPFWSYAGAAGTHAYARALPRNTSWAHVPLVTNIFTGAIPAIVNVAPPPLPPTRNAATTAAASSNRAPNSAEREGGGDTASHIALAASRAAHEVWRGMWMFPHARSLLERRIVEPVRAVASLPVAAMSAFEETSSWRPAYFEDGRYVLGGGGGGKGEVNGKRGVKKHKWWSVKDRRDGVLLDLGAFLTYAQVCGGEMLDGKGLKEGVSGGGGGGTRDGGGVFEDGKGSFKVPEMWVAQ